MLYFKVSQKSDEKNGLNCSFCDFENVWCFYHK